MKGRVASRRRRPTGQSGHRSDDDRDARRDAGDLRRDDRRSDSRRARPRGHVRLKVVLRGAREAWRLADTLAMRKIPVIVGPLTTVPGDDDPYDLMYANPGVLARAGVKIAFQTSDALQLTQPAVQRGARRRVWSRCRRRVARSHDQCRRDLRRRRSVREPLAGEGGQRRRHDRRSAGRAERRASPLHSRAAGVTRRSPHEVVRAVQSETEVAVEKQQRGQSSEFCPLCRFQLSSLARHHRSRARCRHVSAGCAP